MRSRVALRGRASGNLLASPRLTAKGPRCPDPRGRQLTRSDGLGDATYSAMANRRARLAECVAVAVAIGRAAMAVFSVGGDPTLGD
jgi:hypothetical protein